MSAALDTGLYILSTKNEPQEVLPGLFIGTNLKFLSSSVDLFKKGSHKCATDTVKLQELGITHILTVGAPSPQPEVFLLVLLCFENQIGFQEFVSKSLDGVDDLESSNLFPFFEESVEWIDEARKKGKCLVHWYFVCVVFF